MIAVYTIMLSRELDALLKLKVFAGKDVFVLLPNGVSISICYEV